MWILLGVNSLLCYQVHLDINDASTDIILSEGRTYYIVCGLDIEASEHYYYCSTSTPLLHTVVTFQGFFMTKNFGKTKHAVE